MIILPPADARLLTRELLYVAISRAKRAVTLVGDGEALRAAVEQSEESRSGVLDMLTKRLDSCPMYLGRANNLHGPYPLDTVKGFLDEGTVSPQDLAYDPSEEKWVPLGKFLDLPDEDEQPRLVEESESV